MQNHEEKDQNKKLVGENVIEEILNNHNFEDFKIVLHKKISKCSYRTNKTTTIKLNKKEAEEESAEAIIVAAHEASHALNYKEGITNAKLIKFTELSSKVLGLFTFAYCAISPFIGLGHIWLVIILLLTGIYVLKFHFKYYIHDETATENRALKEVKSVWGKIETDIEFKDVEERNKFRLQKHIIDQKPVQRNILIGYPIFAIAIYFGIQPFFKFIQSQISSFLQ